jgi:uncharacterized membrane protein YjgN (DUF898 family)
MNDAVAVPLTTSRFVFTGRTREYFRIWVVSVCLSIVTLGIYSAWGKVRKRRYLYAHTKLDGTGFEYRASPIAILKGRIIVVLLFGGFALSAHVLPLAQAAFALLLIALTPWIVVATSRFNARNSAWRNIAFGFDGRIGEAARVILGLGALALVTLGFGYPYFRMRRARFIIAHHRFGVTPFRADFAIGGFILTYLLAALMLIGTGVLFAISMGALAYLLPKGSRGGGGSAVFLLAPLVLYAVSIAIFAYVRAQIGNITMNGLVVGSLRCRSTLRTRDLIWLYFSNIVAVLGTLGLATPWATLRMARYRAQNLYLVGHALPAKFTGAPASDSRAAGSEAGDLYDVDVSL